VSAKVGVSVFQFIKRLSPLMGKFMKIGHSTLRAAIAVALAASSAGAFAGMSNTAFEAITTRTAETPRVRNVPDNRVMSVIPKTHLASLPHMTLNAMVAASFGMDHMQLVLQPSTTRSSQLQALIAQQHAPGSADFHQWLTPQQFGRAFGVLDSDIDAVKSWLVAQGFTVNGVYPNKLQIDFSGTAGDVEQAFHTHEAYYALGKQQFIANTSDISLPEALRPVVAGVVGLNDFPAVLQQQEIHQATPTTAQWNAKAQAFAQLSKASDDKTEPMAVGGGTMRTLRGLVPNDLANMYGVIPIRANGVTGKGVTIALVELGDVLPSEWQNFITQFNLAQYGGTFQQINPQLSGMDNCADTDKTWGTHFEAPGAIEDSEWAAAIAPGANIVVASCSQLSPDASSNHYGGTFISANNLINGDSRPDIMSVTLSYGENRTDSASKTAIDQIMAQADAEGISVFAITGNTGTDPDYNGQILNGAGAFSGGSLATSPNVTAVGGTDLADEYDGTTSTYFRSQMNVAYGTAIGYVPEIPWNSSCGNGVIAKHYGYSNVLDFCKFLLTKDPYLEYVTSMASSSGASVVDAKPAWQKLVYGAANDNSRDIPDVSLFGGSYSGGSLAGGNTGLIICSAQYPCTADFTSPVQIDNNSSLAAPMFAGIQALIDQGVAMRGLSADQGNAAPTLYALASQEYGGPVGPASASLAACSADNGEAKETSNCVFRDITRGSTSTQCRQEDDDSPYAVPTPNCYFYADGYDVHETHWLIGLTSLDPSRPYSPATKAFSTGAGWDFATGLGSVNARNLLIAWRAFLHAPAAAPSR